MMTAEKGFAKNILGILEDYDISFEHLPSGIDTVSVVMSNKKLDGRLDEILEEFQRKLLPDTMDVFKNMS